jgi:hypothetical protein
VRALVGDVAGRPDREQILGDIRIAQRAEVGHPEQHQAVLENVAELIQRPGETVVDVGRVIAPAVGMHPRALEVMLDQPGLGHRGVERVERQPPVIGHPAIVVEPAAVTDHRTSHVRTVRVIGDGGVVGDDLAMGGADGDQVAERAMIDVDFAVDDTDDLAAPGQSLIVQRGHVELVTLHDPPHIAVAGGDFGGVLEVLHVGDRSQLGELPRCGDHVVQGARKRAIAGDNGRPASRDGGFHRGAVGIWKQRQGDLELPLLGQGGALCGLIGRHRLADRGIDFPGRLIPPDPAYEGDFEQRFRRGLARVEMVGEIGEVVAEVNAGGGQYNLARGVEGTVELHDVAGVGMDRHAIAQRGAQVIGRRRGHVARAQFEREGPGWSVTGPRGWARAENRRVSDESTEDPMGQRGLSASAGPSEHVRLPAKNMWIPRPIGHHQAGCAGHRPW